MLKVAILGAGYIAGLMAATIKEMDDAVVWAVAARDLKRAQEFAARYGIPQAYGSYEEMVQDPDVDLVYIAVPHSHHYQTVKLCLENGKHVLNEKAFAVNEAQAAELIDMAKAKKLLLTEAMWTRYMPSRKMLQELLASGVIGKITSLEANLGYVLGHLERNIRPELAGGALLDLGVYALNFAAMVFGEEVVSMTSSCVKEATGVDGMNSITLNYKDGRMAVLSSNQNAVMSRNGIIYGDQGYVVVDNINNIQTITVYDRDRRMVQIHYVPGQISGYEYEVEACARAIANGDLECPEMPHAETLRIMAQMDALRREWGYVIPGQHGE